MYNAKKEKKKKKTSVMGPPIYLSFYNLLGNGYATQLCSGNNTVQLDMTHSSIANYFINFMVYMVKINTKTKDRDLHSIFFLSRGQTANQTIKAMIRAKPMEMSRTPHQGSLSKPSTAVPSFTGGKGPRGVLGKKGKVLLRQQAACATINKQH